MSFDIEQFYAELDRHYDQHDNEATRAFLLSQIEKTRTLHDVSVTPVSCPSCVELPTVNMEYVSVCNEAACFFRGLSELPESLHWFDEALDELARYYERNTANYATILLNKAGTLRLMGRFEDSIAAFSEAETFFLREEEPNGYLLASVYNNLSLVYQDQGDLAGAAAYTQRALDCLPRVKELDVERATTLNNLAGLAYRTGDYEKAEKAVAGSIAILKEMDCGINPHYPATLNTAGLLHDHAGRYEEALSCFLEALEKNELVYGKNIDYVNCCRNISSIYKKLGKEEEAARYTEAADGALAQIKQEG